MKDPCVICKEPAEWELSTGDSHRIICPRCGNYSITGRAATLIANAILSKRQIANMCGWLNENQPSLITGNVDSLLKTPTPSFHERADKLLLAFEEMTEHAGQSFHQTSKWLTYGWCLNEEELIETITFLVRIGRIKEAPAGTYKYKIDAEGWAHLEELKKVNADSQQGFVAMWFDDSMKKIYDKVISKGILDAGYNPHLVINREHNGKIDDKIIAQIRRSRFLLADFTGHRGGVYYEAGFAQGLGIEVIWTCNKDDLNNLHFDIRQYNCIDWTDKTEDDLKEFKRRITSRIEASIGRGSYQQQE